MSSIKETAQRFFDTCERGGGWESCQEYCHSSWIRARKRVPFGRSYAQVRGSHLNWPISADLPIGYIRRKAYKDVECGPLRTDST